ncbi:MAG: hypothetical protein Q9218_003203 [Villophora microphyllina]
MTRPLNLTFGVELEVIFRYDLQRYEKYIDADDGVFGELNVQEKQDFGGSRDDAKLNRLVRADIIDCLRGAGIPVHGLLDKPKRQNEFSQWTISYDVSIQTPKDGACYTGVEIKSPVLFFSKKADEHIRKVIALLKQNFTVSTNESCGLHVHVGNRKDGFPLTTVKNLSMLVTAFERQVNSLHPASRATSRLCRPPGRLWHRMAPESVATAIERFTDLDSLVERLSVAHLRSNAEVGRFWAYNFINLTPKTDDPFDTFGSSGSNTIEFRQHAGTTDTREIISWAQLCCILVHSSHERGELGWYGFIAEHLYATNYTVIHLIRDLGYDESAYDKLAEYYGTERKIYDHPKQMWQWQNPRDDEPPPVAAAAVAVACAA